MSEELRKKYPDLLGRCSEFSVGPGWTVLVETLLLAMQDEEKSSGIKFHIVQVKEKFAGLRFYFDADSQTPEAKLSLARMEERVRRAGELSYKTCEQCGQPGRVRGDRWFVTLCDACARSMRGKIRE